MNQWQILTQRSCLVVGYSVWHYTVALDLTSRSGFATGMNISHIQWNSLKKSPVKKISRLRSQDKKAPKFSHFIKITLLRNFPLKK
jgi:hypothetical protein